jgi:LytR cell envelope-related transcriptional attenuator
VGPSRVMVQDGAARRPGAEDRRQAVGVRLLGAGYRYIDGGKADERVRRTQVRVSDAARDGRRAGEQVALTLGVPTSAVAVVSADEIAADILVIVGDDFRP